MKVIWFFYLYSFLGFLLEVAYARAVGLGKLDRKCRLLLPLCPVYGLGGVAIVSLPPAVQACPPALFVASALLSTGAEYLCGWFYEGGWGVKFWDYSTLPGNLQGRICLPFALIWGMLGLGLCFLVHPMVEQVVFRLPDLLLVPVSIVFWVDFILTDRLLRRKKTTQALRWYRL